MMHLAARNVCGRDLVHARRLELAADVVDVALRRHAQGDAGEALGHRPDEPVADALGELGLAQRVAAVALGAAQAGRDLLAADRHGLEGDVRRGRDEEDDEDQHGQTRKLTIFLSTMAPNEIDSTAMMSSMCPVLVTNSGFM